MKVLFQSTKIFYVKQSKNIQANVIEPSTLTRLNANLGYVNRKYCDIIIIIIIMIIIIIIDHII